MRPGLLALLLVACAPPTEAPFESGPPDAGSDADAGSPTFELPPPARIGSGRTADVRVPAGYDGKRLFPAVFALPGYSFTAADLEDWLGLAARVDADGFVLVTPEGLVDSEGNTYWNATETCCDFDGAGPDDERFLTGLRDELLRRFAVDPRRVAIVGHSNGAFMGYRLACRDAPGWSAIASVAGSMWRDLSACAPSSPVSVLQVHGLEDDVMPFDGDGDAPAALAVLGRWAALDACGSDRSVEDDGREYVRDALPDETVASRFAGCAPGFDVELWQVAGAGHTPAFRPSFTEALVAWVLAHPRP